MSQEPPPSPAPLAAPSPTRVHPVRRTHVWHDALILAFSFALAGLMLILALRMAEILALVFLGIIIGQALAPPVNHLSRWMPRAIALILVYLLLTGLVIAAFWLALPPVIGQLWSFVHDAPAMIDHLSSWLNQLVPGQGHSLARNLKGPVMSLSQHFLTLPLVLSSVVVDAVIVIFLSMYWILTAPALNAFTLSLVPEHLKPQASDLFDELGSMLGGYVRGDVIDSALIGVVAYIGMRVIGVPFPVLIGLLAGIGDLVPLVGPTAAQFIAAAIALTQSPVQAIVTLAFFLILEQIDGNVTQPLIMRGVSRIPPILIVLGLAAGGFLGGVLGAIIAIPLLGAVRIIVVRVVAPLVRSSWESRSTD